MTDKIWNEISRLDDEIEQKDREIYVLETLIDRMIQLLRDNKLEVPDIEQEKNAMMTQYLLGAIHMHQKHLATIESQTAAAAAAAAAAEINETQRQKLEHSRSMIKRKIERLEAHIPVSDVVSTSIPLVGSEN
jgi:predicted  nucleic acid-binding Zn-ribbon protein